eukprot:NODE_939_length_1131_cov_99.770795_g652_i0.p1 GENE.NODE_939_length_1131_cov_99.770795_g652_i0~~NODE_939_length_1131_cov_99.770795_g652_i0.p1  ORF type:complete len:149 (-),score=28.10 NODE_939_length_1131_cov_99.770795_g652_i0:519-965(-)
MFRNVAVCVCEHVCIVQQTAVQKAYSELLMLLLLAKPFFRSPLSFVLPPPLPLFPPSPFFSPPSPLLPPPSFLAPPPSSLAPPLSFILPPLQAPSQQASRTGTPDVAVGDGGGVVIGVDVVIEFVGSVVVGVRFFVLLLLLPSLHSSY